MLEARFRSLPKWTESRKLQALRSPFKATYMRTLDLLEYELRKLSARDVVIEAGFPSESIRNDGWPRSGTKPIHPGVILYFNSKGDPLRFPAGTYTPWTANLHAIALTLENLRAIDRYGVTLGHEQYQGFKALPAPQTPDWTVESAAVWLANHVRSASGVAGFTPAEIVNNYDYFRSSYKQAAIWLHPDKGGQMELFQVLQEVKARLETHHGIGSGGS